MTLLKQTFERLVASGYTEHPAKEKIGAVLSYEVYDVLRDKRKFDREKFVSFYRKLRVPLKIALNRENEIGVSNTRKGSESGLAPGEET